jgi:very-short-patch-repair endonuclease
MPRTTYTKSCAQCGATFTTIDPRQRFCRRACLHAYQSSLFADRVTLICQQCGATYEQKPSLAQTSHYCSRQCSDAAQREVLTLDCKVCGKPFQRIPSRAGEYCSYRCMGADQRDRIQKACEVCGKPFEVNRARDTLRSTCSRACKRIAWVETVRSYVGKRGETKPEQQVRNALEQIGVAYQPQYAVAGYLVDFYLPDHCIALEVDGVYWHTLADQPDKDCRRDARLRTLGIATIRITDAELSHATDIPALLRSRLRL